MGRVAHVILKNKELPEGGVELTVIGGDFVESGFEIVSGRTLTESELNAIQSKFGAEIHSIWLDKVN
jgi:hypothetical protein